MILDELLLNLGKRMSKFILIFEISHKFSLKVSEE
jgi:hypothetical protein